MEDIAWLAEEAESSTVLAFITICTAVGAYSSSLLQGVGNLVGGYRAGSIAPAAVAVSQVESAVNTGLASVHVVRLTAGAVLDARNELIESRIVHETRYDNVGGSAVADIFFVVWMQCHPVVDRCRLLSVY